MSGTENGAGSGDDASTNPPLDNSDAKEDNAASPVPESSEQTSGTVVGGAVVGGAVVGGAVVGGGQDDSQSEQQTAQTASAPLTYHDFLEKMKHPSAIDLVKSLKSFINMIMRQDLPQDGQSELVKRYLLDAEKHTKSHPLWRNATEEELDNVREGLEKYLMTRIYKKAFAPTPEEEDRDKRLTQRLRALQFLTLAHFDIPQFFENQKALNRACEELNKMNSFKAPRDKMICILNSCKLINNAIYVARNRDGQFGCDEFLPLFIYVTLKGVPEYLWANINYISRYRNPSKLSGEAGYFFTQLCSAVSFLEMADSSQLSIEKEEFDRLYEEYYDDANVNTIVETENQESAENKPDDGSDSDLKIAKRDSVETLGITLEGASGTSYGSELAAVLEEGVGTSGDAEDVGDEPLSPTARSRAKSVRDARNAISGDLKLPQVLREFDRTYRFLTCDYADLKMKDIPDLLDDYKKLAYICEKLLSEQEGK
eukprot:GFYU01006722.1.p1 GENE.GFYU01006722.1~~GFYU01006722.1.p1  ORF type:complete len:484 (-),score=99.48 GFYU01006722.1:16-1467(-)